MPRYYLNIERRGEVIVDFEGEEFDTPEAAHLEAIRSAREIMADRVARGKAPNDSTIDILDEARRSILRVPFKDAISDN